MIFGTCVRILRMGTIWNALLREKLGRPWISRKTSVSSNSGPSPECLEISGGDACLNKMNRRTKPHDKVFGLVEGNGFIPHIHPRGGEKGTYSQSFSVAIDSNSYAHNIECFLNKNIPYYYL